MRGVIERLEHVRAVGIDPGRGHLIHQARLSQLAREADKTTVQHVVRFERQRRHATLVAIALDFTASLTDQAIDLFDRLVGGIFRKAEGRQARAFQADARAINEKVRLYARVGAALITAQTDKQDAFGAITAVIPWERFCKTVAEAEHWPGRKNLTPSRTWESTMPVSDAGHPRSSRHSNSRAYQHRPRSCAPSRCCGR